MKDEIKAIMADVLGVDVDAIDESTSTENTETWDSVAHVNLIAALEQSFDVTFEIAEIEAIVSFGKIVEALQRRR